MLYKVRKMIELHTAFSQEIFSFHPGKSMKISNVTVADSPTILPRRIFYIEYRAYQKR